MGNKQIKCYTSEEDAINDNYYFIKTNVIIGSYLNWKIYSVYNSKCQLNLDKIEVKYNDYKLIFENGVLHSDIKPAVYHKLSHCWFKNGIIHREDGPAFYSKDFNSSLWMYNGWMSSYGLNSVIILHSHPLHNLYFKKGKKYKLWQLRTYGRIIFRALYKYYIMKKRKIVSQTLQENGCIVFPGLIDLIV